MLYGVCAVPTYIHTYSTYSVHRHIESAASCTAELPHRTWRIVPELSLQGIPPVKQRPQCPSFPSFAITRHSPVCSAYRVDCREVRNRVFSVRLLLASSVTSFVFAPPDTAGKPGTHSPIAQVSKCSTGSRSSISLFVLTTHSGLATHKKLPSGTAPMSMERPLEIQGAQWRQQSRLGSLN